MVKIMFTEAWYYITIFFHPESFTYVCMDLADFFKVLVAASSAHGGGGCVVL